MRNCGRRCSRSCGVADRISAQDATPHSRWISSCSSFGVACTTGMRRVRELVDVNAARLVPAISAPFDERFALRVPKQGSRHALLLHDFRRRQANSRKNSLPAHRVLRLPMLTSLIRTNSELPQPSQSGPLDSTRSARPGIQEAQLWELRAGGWVHTSLRYRQIFLTKRIEMSTESTG